MVGDMEEYLALQEDGSRKLVMRGKNCSSTDIKVPEGAEIAVENGLNKGITFYKDNGECQFDKKWITCNVEDKNGSIHVNLKTYLGALRNLMSDRLMYCIAPSVKLCH